MTDHDEQIWYLRGADDRLTVMRRPQGCVDLVLDGKRSIAYLTGVGGTAPELLAAAGVGYRIFGDPAGPLLPPIPSVWDALTALVDACETGAVPGDLAVAYARARRVLDQRPAPTEPATAT